jgi:TRAP-type C4-dicarboxylate transport system permease small subunit
LLHQFAEALDKRFVYVENIIRIMSAVFFFILMLIGSFDVIGRYVFNKPIVGTLEISKLLLLGLVVLSWGYTQRENDHVRFEMVVNRLSKRFQRILDFIRHFIELILFTALVWQGTVLAVEYWPTGRYIAHVGIPIALVQLLVPLGASIMCIEIIIQIIRLISHKEAN